jgi:hypothetical protein
MQNSREQLLPAVFRSVRAEDHLLEKVTVGENEAGPLFRHVVLKEDRLNRADFGANAAVDALGWIDEVLLCVVLRVNAIDRANFDAGRILRPNAWLGDDVCHRSRLLAPTYGAIEKREVALGPL